MESFGTRNESRLEKSVSFLQQIIEYAEKHDITKDELLNFLEPVTTLIPHPADNPDPIPEDTLDRLPEDPQQTHTDQVKLSRYIHSLNGYSFKTVIAAVMSRLTDGED